MKITTFDPYTVVRKTTKAAESGWVLSETMIAVFVGITFLVGIIGILINCTITFAELGNYVNMDRRSRNALDRITTSIRSAKSLISYGPSTLAFNYDAAGTTNLTYRYDSSSGMLTEEWTAGGTTTATTLLSGCSNLAFSVYDRDLIPINDGSAGKVIGIAWQCTSTALNRTNREYMQQAQIVIRNQP